MRNATPQIAILAILLSSLVVGCSIGALPPPKAASEGGPGALDLGASPDRADTNGAGGSDLRSGEGGAGGNNMGGAGGIDAAAGGGGVIATGGTITDSGITGSDAGTGATGGVSGSSGTGGAFGGAGGGGASPGTGGSDASAGTGGSPGTGGGPGTGGNPGTGGGPGTGGTVGTGGAASTGGSGGGGDREAGAPPCTVTDVVELVSGYKTWQAAGTLDGFCVQVIGATSTTQVNCVDMQGRAITLDDGPTVSTCVGQTSCTNFYLTLGAPWSDGAWYISVTPGLYAYPVLAFFPGVSTK
jgi:hypothetical protein